jgi:hypothetical protein
MSDPGGEGLYLRLFSHMQDDVICWFWHGYVLREEGTASRALTPAHCILLIAHIARCKYRLTPAHCISLIVYLTPYVLRFTPYVFRLTPYTLRLISYILRLTSYTLHLTPYTLHLTSYTLHLTSYTLRLTSYTLRLTYVLHLTPYTLRLTSYILSYHILYRVTCIRLVCKTSMIRCFYHKAETVIFLKDL